MCEIARRFKGLAADGAAPLKPGLEPGLSRDDGDGPRKLAESVPDCQPAIVRRCSVDAEQRHDRGRILPVEASRQR